MFYAKNQEMGLGGVLAAVAALCPSTYPRNDTVKDTFSEYFPIFLGAFGGIHGEKEKIQTSYVYSPLGLYALKPVYT